MDISQLTEDQITFWQIDLSTKSKTAFQFAHLLTGGHKPASICTFDAFEEMLSNIECLRTCQDLFPEIGKFVWLSYKKLTESNSLPAPSGHSSLLSLTPTERCAIAMVDLLGLDIHATASAIGWAESETYSQIAHARRKLVELRL